ncbi:hypothetical protein ACFW2N_21005, partial [Streptomyces sp. NPDC058855]
MSAPQHRAGSGAAAPQHPADPAAAREDRVPGARSAARAAARKGRSLPAGPGNARAGARRQPAAASRRRAPAAQGQGPRAVRTPTVFPGEGVAC